LSYAGMITLPGYTFAEHYQRRQGRPMPFYLRPSRREVADYLATYPYQVGIEDVIHNGQQVGNVSRHNDGFYIGSHDLACKNLVLASGIFSKLIPPPALLRPLLDLDIDGVLEASPDPILVIGSGFSAADVIISSPPDQRIIHIYKWEPSTSPSPLRACHQQAYPEYAAIYRRMKAAAVSSSPMREKRPRLRQTLSEFERYREWETTYEGLANAQVVDVRPAEGGTAAAVVQIRLRNDVTISRRVGRFEYVVGRRGSLEYLSAELCKEVVPPDDRDGRCMISGQTLREQVIEDIEVAPHVFAIGSLTGDSLIRFAYGGCAYAAGRIMRRKPTKTVSPGKEKCGTATTMSSRAGTPSPRITAMNGLDGHDASPGLSLSDRGRACMPLDRRKD